MLRQDQMFCRPFQLAPICFFAIVMFCVEGVKAESDTRNLRIHRWTTDDGLPQHRIACLKQTQDGYLWLGTWYGLVRFNGVSFTVFNEYNTPEFSDSTINALAEDTTGTLWIGTADGLLSYRNQRFRQYTTKDGLPDRKILRLTTGVSGALWLQTESAFARFENERFSPPWKPKLPGRVIHFIEEGPDGWLNVFQDKAWVALSPKGDQIRTNVVLNSSATWNIGIQAQGTSGMWAGSSNGLQFIEPGLIKTFSSTEMGRRPVGLVYQDRSTNVWTGTRPAGLFFWDRKNWKTIDLTQDGWPLQVVCMGEDREGNIWVGTTRGLFQIQKRRVQTITTADGLADDNVCSVCEGKGGEIWAATDKGLSCIRNSKVVDLGTTEPNAEARDRCVWPNAEGGVWVAKQDDGLYEFTQGRFQHVVEQIVFPGGAGALFVDHSGRLCIGTVGGVVTLGNGQLLPLERTQIAPEFDHVTPSPWDSSPKQFPLREVRSILQDREGIFWFGTDGHGLLRLGNGALTRFTRREGLSNNRVWSLHEDGQGTLWVGTENGLTRYRKGNFFVFTTQHGLQENTINCILEDDFGCFWLSGLKGIYRIKRAQLDDIANGRATQVECAIVDTADGMESSETNGERQPAGWKAHDGRLWFPTTQGVVVIDPKTYPISDVPPPVVLEQVIADDRVIGGGLIGADGRRRRSDLETSDGNRSLSQKPEVRLAPGRAQAIEFYYTANTFVDPKRARFRYRLTRGSSTAEWREATADRVARYTNLRPGSYRFEVIGANHHGVWNPVPALFLFSVGPHFYETWPFYAFCYCSAFGLTVAVVVYRLRWQRRILKLEEQQAVANERTRIARDLHDDLGTALTGLALELDVVGSEAKSDKPVTERLAETARHTRDLAERMREVVWTVNPRCDNVLGLASFLEQQVGQFLRSEGFQVRLDFPEDIPALPVGADARHQLALSVREALTNVVRHAQATRVVLSLAIAEQQLVVQVKDNGRGFQPTENNNGHGLENMRTRLKQVGGAFECVSNAQTGTVITFRIPLTNHSSQEN